MFDCPPDEPVQKTKYYFSDGRVLYPEGCVEEKAQNHREHGQQEIEHYHRHMITAKNVESF